MLLIVVDFMLLLNLYLLALVCIILLLWKSLLLIAKSKAKQARIVYYNLLITYSTYKIRIY